MTEMKPPSDLLKQIAHKMTIIDSYVSARGIRAKLELPTYPSKRYYRFVAGMFIGAVEKYFAVPLSIIKAEYKGDLDEEFLNFVILGLLHNAAKHGNKNNEQKKILMGWWFGNEGILIGVKDEGDFFHRQSVKKAVESRQHLISSDKPGKEADLVWIIDEADDLCVSGGALYVLILFESLILKPNQPDPDGILDE